MKHQRGIAESHTSTREEKHTAHVKSHAIGRVWHGVAARRSGNRTCLMTDLRSMLDTTSPETRMKGSDLTTPLWSMSRSASPALRQLFEVMIRTYSTRYIPGKGVSGLSRDGKECSVQYQTTLFNKAQEGLHSYALYLCAVTYAQHRKRWIATQGW